VALLGTAADAKEFADSGKVKEGSSRVQAVCDFYGPADFLNWGDQPGAKSNVDADSPNSPVGRLLGGPVKQNKEKARQASPVTYASKDDPPFLILHGDADTTVPLRQSELLHEALTKAGVDSTLIVVPKVGHSGQVAAGENAGKILAFFDKHLKGKK
jgi:acetyl esterase/lipase